MFAGKDKVQGYLCGIIKTILVREMTLDSHCHKEYIQSVLLALVVTGRMTVTVAKTSV